MVKETKPPAPEPVPRSVEEWRQAKGTPAWLFAATATRLRWEIGTQVIPTALTETEYDSAVTETATMRL